MIKITNLNKYYNKNKSNEIHVIDNTSIELPSTGFITFLGHSGSGKTTLLNVIGGLDKATGKIEYDDTTFNKYKVGKIDKFRSRNIGYVFQNYNLLLNETVYDNLRIALELIGITNPEEVDKRIEYTLNAVGMYKFRKKLASNLSGGQQQRVSIARALIKKSKIIIADEPTGNLDSKNTIEVMNILKKISEKALVLLVTHEEKMANFYSDIIFELKDGKIINSINNDSNGLLDEEKSDEIYLKDLEKKEEQTDIGSITVYSDGSKDLKADLSFIIKNGTIYLKTSESIKIADDNIKIIDDHYKPMDKKQIESFDYDTSWYNDKIDDKKKFHKFINRIRNSFITFRSVSKKQKFVYLCLATIGFVLSIAFVSLANGTMTDLGYYSYSSNVNTIYSDSPKNIKKVLKDAYNEKEIDNVLTFDSYNTISYKENVLYNYSISVTNNIAIVPFDMANPTLSYGKKPTEINEIVISSSVAQKIADSTNRDMSEIVGLPLNDDLLITGISTGDNKMGYVTNEAFDLSEIRTSYYYDRYIIIDGIYMEYPYTFKNKSDVQYEIKAGRDIEDSSSEVLAFTGEIGNTVSFGNKSYEIVGLYDNYKYQDENTYIIDQEFTVECSNKVGLFADSSLFDVIEGHYPTNSQEVLVPKRSGLSIGDKTGGYTVVGYFDGASNISYYGILSKSGGTLSNSYFNQNNVTFSINNKEAFEKRLSNSGFELSNLEKVVNATTKQQLSEVLGGFLAVFAICVTAAALFVYFIMRSKMLSDIYSIGVYRSLGASRFRINRKYLSDIFILTTFTGLIGYIIGTLGYIWIAYIINSLSYSLISTNILMVSNLFTILGALAMYVIMFIFGMLPIIFLQRKTPSEICSKYDI